MLIYIDKILKFDTDDIKNQISSARPQDCAFYQRIVV